MAEHPRGVWIWRRANLHPDHMRRLVERRVKRVYLKVFDSVSTSMFWSFQCSPEVVEEFKAVGIEVYGWGYHRGSADVEAEVNAVRKALDCGLAGYVLDVEIEVKNPATHPHVEQLLRQLRPHVPAGALGYTSFGHPGKHPEVPWEILDSACDLALPQIYFEKFTFGRTNEDEVQACLEAHRARGLDKPILPIWGSESDSAAPASASELQRYLDRFPGSSLWRVPNLEERGEALNLDYSGSPVVTIGGAGMFELPPLTRLLRRRSQGADVEALQRALDALGLQVGGIDGDFGPATERAVLAFQLQAGVTVDGIVGAITWAALRGKFEVDLPELGVLARLADIALEEGAKPMIWNGPTSHAEKYLRPFRAPMQALGHIGVEPVFFNWCAAFVAWCCRKAGIDIPDRPEGFFATMALVEAWKFWAQKNGFWHPTGSIFPRRGDILVFEWFDQDLQLDHIGIAQGYREGDAIIQTTEGNRGNRTVNGQREMKNVAGFIRIIAG